MISIIIPTYNRAHLIGETIESIQKQTYKDWECIIVDDGSTDNTSSLIASYSKNDSRIRFFKRPNDKPKGPSACRNYGLQKSKGKYINWFDSDDLMHPQKLEIDLKHIESGDFDFTISQSDFFKDFNTEKKFYWNANLWSEDPINDFIVKKIGWGVNSPLWKKSTLIKSQLNFNENLMTADDYLYHIEALHNNLKPVIINKILVSQRTHANRLNNLTSKSKYKFIVYDYLLSNKQELALNKTILFFINDRVLRGISKLFKMKHFKSGLFNSLFFLGKINTIKFIKILLRLNIAGLFYYVFNSGYKFLKVKPYDESLKAIKKRTK